MSWVPGEAGAASEREARLGLKPEAYEQLRRILTAAWRATDPQLLDLCRLRLAQLSGARAELEGQDETLLARLENWEKDAGFSEAAGAVLAFAEQYHYDHQSL